jgi:hypothetical protein
VSPAIPVPRFGHGSRVPGSDSSALHTRYLSMSPWGRNDAFWPIRNPAPPRPRRPESVICESTSSGDIARAVRSG